MSINSICIKVIRFTLFFSIISCSSEKTQQPIKTSGEDESIDTIRMLEPEVYSSIEPVSDSQFSEEIDYKVVLSVDSVMYLGQSGMMEVWIGSEDIDVKFSKGMTQDEKTIPSSIGQYAKITPYAPDFEVTSLAATICYKIDPSGSEIRYSLTPKNEGNYKVSAEIELYQTEDCTGISIPKTARALSVSVGINSKNELSKRIHEMQEVVWDKFMIFWVALITLLFGAAIYLVRRYIKNKTGFEGPV